MPKVLLPGSVQPLVCFYDSSDQPYYAFANYSRTPLTIVESDGTTITYPTPEHYFQAQKIVDPNNAANQTSQRRAFVNDPIIANSPDKARTQVSRFLINGQLPAGWHTGVKMDAMREVVRQRCQQDPSFLQLLQSTDPLPIVEDTGGASYIDDEWGCGLKGTGHNKLGLILMEIRAESFGYITPQQAQQEAALLYASVQGDIQKLGRTQLGTLIQNVPGVTPFQGLPAPQVAPAPHPQATSSLYQLLQFNLGQQTVNGITVQIKQSTRNNSIEVSGTNKNGEGRRFFVKPNGTLYAQYQTSTGNWQDSDAKGIGSRWTRDISSLLASNLPMTTATPAAPHTPTPQVHKLPVHLYTLLRTNLGQHTINGITVHIQASMRNNSIEVSGTNKVGDGRRFFVTAHGAIHGQYQANDGQWYDSGAKGVGSRWTRDIAPLLAKHLASTYSASPSSPAPQAAPTQGNPTVTKKAVKSGFFGRLFDAIGRFFKACFNVIAKCFSAIFCKKSGKGPNLNSGSDFKHTAANPSGASITVIQASTKKEANQAAYQARTGFSKSLGVSPDHSLPRP